MTPVPSAKAPVLVLSSFVARGSVGARAAFALERLGHPVWTVPTILLPYHPGHTAKQGRGTRIVTPPESFAALLADLARSSWLPDVGAIVSGYLGDPAQASAVAEIVHAVKQANPNAFYLCDPVLGDGAGLYVPQPTAEAIRDQLIPLADIATPNAFELGWLTGRAVTSPQEAIAAARALGPTTVAVTSAPAMMRDAVATMLVSAEYAITAEHPAVQGAPNGPGDLFAALLTARRLQGLSDDAWLESAVAGTFDVIVRSVRAGCDEMNLTGEQDSLVRPMSSIHMRRVHSASHPRR